MLHVTVPLRLAAAAPAIEGRLVTAMTAGLVWHHVQHLFHTRPQRYHAQQYSLKLMICKGSCPKSSSRRNNEAFINTEYRNKC